MAFPATRLSVVERTRSGDAETRRVALAAIIEAYWKPSYKYLRLKWSLDSEAAADLTQEFFTSTLEKEVIERDDPERARFRTYLRLCLDGLAANARKAEGRLKRGGGVTVVPLDFQTAEGEVRSHEPAVQSQRAEERARALGHLRATPRAFLAIAVGDAAVDRQAASRAMYVRHSGDSDLPSQGLVGRGG